MSIPLQSRTSVFACHNWYAPIGLVTPTSAFLRTSSWQASLFLMSLYLLWHKRHQTNLGLASHLKDGVIEKK